MQIAEGSMTGTMRNSFEHKPDLRELPSWKLHDSSFTYRGDTASGCAKATGLRNPPILSNPFATHARAAGSKKRAS